METATKEVFSLENDVAAVVSEFSDNLVLCVETYGEDLRKIARKIYLTHQVDAVIELVNALKTESSLDERTFKENVTALLDSMDLKGLIQRNTKVMNKEELVPLTKIADAHCTYKINIEKIVSAAVNALKCYEAEVITHFTNASLLQDLVQGACKAKFITEKVKTRITSVHFSVPHSLIGRYLMLHVYETIAKSYNLIELWLSLLLKYEGISTVLDLVKLYYERLKGATDVYNVEEEIASVKQLAPDIHFEDKHVAGLSNALASCSSYWREIAISLGLPHNEISSIESMMLVRKVIGCLNEVLHTWIIRKYDCAKPPTLKCLRSALRSEIVGLGVEANSLQEKLMKEGVLASKDRSLIATALPKKDKNIFKIVDQSLDTIVSEDNSVLLFGVQVNSSPGTSLTYQWCKDGKVLKLNDKYNGSRDGIISIYIDDLTVEGSYTCIIARDDHKIYSDPILLKIKTQLDQYRGKLNDFYTAKPEIPEDTWPPVNIDTYINLALIKQQGIDKGDEYAHSTIRGDADDVFKDKERIEYESVFDDLSSGARLLIEGRPGSGKTTLVHKVSKDWARDKLKFNHVRLLFLVHLRGFFSKPNINLRNILECYYDCDTDPSFHDIIKYANKHNGLGLCFILDGLDEYLPEKKNTYIHKLIDRSMLPRSLVIIASRPVAVADFRSSITRQIEVLGFFKEQITEYIKEYNFSVDSKSLKLLKYLDHHPNVHHMCYLPIHTAMVCFLGQVGRSLPETETGIYNEFTICFFLRSLRKDEDDVYIESIQSLPLTEKKKYMKICKLAFEMTVSSEQVMKESKVKDYFNVHSNRDYLGLINVDKVALQHGFQKLYTFLHLTFQEFLSACYISNLQLEEQVELINRLGSAKQMQIVWKFYCGLVKFDDQIKFESLLEKTQYGRLYEVQCSFESQQPSTCHSIIENGTLSFKNNFFTPSDFTAIAFVISNAIQNICELVFDQCTLSQEGINVLEEKARDNLSSVTTLCFHGHNCVAKQLRLVNKLMHILPSLQILDITNTQLGKDAVEALTCDLNHSNLVMVEIDASDSNPLYSSKELIQSLIESFTSKCSNFFNLRFSDYSKYHSLSLPFYYSSVANFDDINISFYKLGSAGVKVLSDDLRANSVCSRLSLIGCGITDEGAKTFSDAITKCNSIEVLELNLNFIGDEGAVALAHGIKSCLSLHTLNLSCNQIGDDGALAVVNALSAEHSVSFKLSLWNNNITKCGADTLLHVKCAISIDSLDISGRNIGNEGAEVVSSCLDFFDSHDDKHDFNDFRSLHTLDLSSSIINDDGVKLIVDSLKNYKSLTSLKLSGNPAVSFCSGEPIIADFPKSLLSLDLSKCSIGDHGTKALANALRGCNLISLNVSFNNIGNHGANNLATFIEHSNKVLQVLDISHNIIQSHGVETLSTQLRNCSDLHTLILGCNHIGESGAKFIGNALEHCKNLHTLDIHDNDILCDGANALVCMLKCCNNLHTLDIAYNNICGTALADAIKSCHNLTELNISNNRINHRYPIERQQKSTNKEGTEALASNDIGKNGTEALTGNHCSSTLHTLNISTSKEGTGLADAIKHCSGLQTLNISSIDIGKNALTGVINCCSSTLHTLNIGCIDIKQDAIKALSGAIKNCIKLHTLDIMCNNIGKKGATFLANAIKHCSNLNTLNIGYNDIGTDGTKAIANSIKHCGNLHTLDIAHNNFGMGGAIALARALQHCSDLHTLVISHNNLGKDGIKAVADILIYCRNLHSLDISHNNLDRYGAQVLASSIESGCSCSINLHILDVSNNNIGDDGVRYLMDIMKYRIKLHILNISHNCIGDAGARAVADVIKYCHNLDTLDISYNEIGNFDILDIRTKNLHIVRHYI